MKKIFNWQFGTVVDIETDGLLDTLTKCHVVSYQMYNKSAPASIEGADIEKIKKMLQWHIDKKIPIVGHNFIMFDTPALEMLTGMDLSELMVIDTLMLSFYLNTYRVKHGLDSFNADYGIPKPHIEDWDNLSYEEYRHRCSEDVKINVALWEDLKGRLVEMYTRSKELIDSGVVGGKRMSKDEVIYIDQLKGISVEEHINRILTFLMFKADTYRIQEKIGIKIDRKWCQEYEVELRGKIDVIKAQLEAVMPKIPKYTKKVKPAKAFKKDGTLSASGVNWEKVKEDFKAELKDQYGTPLVIIGKGEDTVEFDGIVRTRPIDEIEEFQIFSDYEEPNANSPDQIKNLLYSHGWVPQTFKEIKDKEANAKWDSDMKIWRSIKGKRPPKPEKPVPRKVPQVTKAGEDGKELCPSVEMLAEDVPAIKLYSNLNMMKHRHSVLKGFIEMSEKDGRIYASMAGFTNTLRVKHRNVVNLVGVDKPYGEAIRGAFIADDGMIFAGSDLSSLEDRTKHHFMLPHDPEYVKTMMADDYDPHLQMAVTAGFITNEDMAEYKAGNKKPHVKKSRRLGKSTNYSSVYGAGAETIAKTAGVDIGTGHILHDAYWKLNWSVKAIAEEQIFVEFDKRLPEFSSYHSLWLVNPLNGFLYSVRAKKDVFSTLCQGTGSYFFDVWVNNVLNAQKKKFKMQKIQLQVHDEQGFCFKDTPVLRDTFSTMIHQAINDVNSEFILRRTLDCETQFGQRYSQIH